MNLRLLFGYIAVLLGLFFAIIQMYIFIPGNGFIIFLSLLGAIVFSISGLIAIKLSYIDTNSASVLFLISGLGMLLTVAEIGLIPGVLFIISSLLEFKNKDKFRLNNSHKRKIIIFINILFILSIPILLFIKTFGVITTVW
ncbi:MAG: hypothetical protein ACRCVG_07205 [Methanobacteriaceae archaeon]